MDFDEILKDVDFVDDNVIQKQNNNESYSNNNSNSDNNSKNNIQFKFIKDINKISKDLNDVKENEIKEIKDKKEIKKFNEIKELISDKRRIKKNQKYLLDYTSDDPDLLQDVAETSKIAETVSDDSGSDYKKGYKKKKKSKSDWNKVKKIDIFDELEDLENPYYSKLAKRSKKTKKKDNLKSENFGKEGKNKKDGKQRKVDDIFDEMQKEPKDHKETKDNKDNADDIFEFPPNVSSILSNFKKNTKSKTKNSNKINKSEIKKPKKIRQVISREANSVDGPLNDITIVFTGLSTLPTKTRDELTDILKGFGARVTAAVSHKTSYLVIGEKLDDGRVVTEGNKFKNAIKFNVPILTYNQLNDLLRIKLKDDNFDLNQYSIEEEAAKIFANQLGDNIVDNIYTIDKIENIEKIDSIILQSSGLNDEEMEEIAANNNLDNNIDNDNIVNIDDITNFISNDMNQFI